MARNKTETRSYSTANSLSSGVLYRKGEAGRVSVAFLATLLLLLAYGLIVMFSASYSAGYYYKGGRILYFITRQLVAVVVGLIGMTVVACINYRWIRRFWVILEALCAVLLIAALLTPMREGFEYHRWIYLGSTSFQPSELAKFSVILTTAHLIETYRYRSSAEELAAWWKRLGQKERVGVEGIYDLVTGLVNIISIVFLPIRFVIYNVPALRSLWKALKQKLLVASNSLVASLLIPLLGIVPLVGLILPETHWSCVVLILLIFFTMLICNGRGWPWIIAGGAAGAGVLGVVLFQKKDYVLTRLAGWSVYCMLTGQEVKMTDQTRNGLYAIASGGFFGMGIGNSRQKHLWLAEASNDFVFSILCEELGFLGALFCMGLFAALVLEGIYIALHSPDLYGTMLGIGIMAQIAWQFLANIAVVTDLLPNTGISLPFFSYGGTSIAVLLCEMGVMISLSRASNAYQAQKEREEREEFARKIGRAEGQVVYRRQRSR